MEQINEFTTFEDVINLFFKQKSEVREISNGVSSIFLDEDNMAYCLMMAEEVQKQYGSNKIPDMNITGDDYLLNVKEMIQVAEDIIDGKLLPDIFDLIPIKKDKTFTKNRTIPIFLNNIIDAAAYEGYVEKNELMLSIVTHGTWTYDKHYDLSEETTKNRARLCITWKEGAKKIVPLLSKDLKVNDITTKATYLKDNDVKAGCIYKEKSGSEYLYLGKIVIIKGYDIKNTVLYHSIRPCHTYIRVTKKIMDFIDKAKSFDDFLQMYVDSKIKSFYDELPLSMRESPRKFVEKTNNKFEDKDFSVVNDSNTPIEELKGLFTREESTYPYDGNKIVNAPYIIIR